MENKVYDWSKTALYANDNGGHEIGKAEYLDAPSLDVAGLNATKRYLYVGSTIQDSANMIVTASEDSLLMILRRRPPVKQKKFLVIQKRLPVKQMEMQKAVI